MLDFELLNVKQPDFKNMLKISVYVDLSPPAHISQILRLFFTSFINCYKYWYWYFSAFISKNCSLLYHFFRKKHTVHKELPRAVHN